MKYFALIFIVLVFLTGCQTPRLNLNINNLNMKLTSPAFINNGELPSKYTCDGQGINPPLKIADVPPNAQSLVLIFDDPDAVSGTFIHWTVWNIGAETMDIPENDVPNNSVQGLTSSRSQNYVPPCPPSGIHHYTFKIFALDTKLHLPADSDINALDTAIQGHILDSAKLISLYKRNK
jgi:Raf kinase inhibitor-like YbhB/YbcL family protein